MRIHFLGTSAGVPTLRRGLPAVAVEREGEIHLFDCGEGTQMALQRSPIKAFRMTAVYITHLHGDHVMGLPGLMMSLQMSGRVEPLAVVGPPGVREFVTVTLRHVGARIVYPLEFTETVGGRVFGAREYEVVAARVDHGVFTLGFRLAEHTRPGEFHPDRAAALAVPPGPLFGRLQRGQSVELPGGTVIQPEHVLGPPRRGRCVAYITDTRPCAAAVDLARDADLLIHEGTFGNEMAAEAAGKGHSTVAGAVDVARSAGARSLFLVHISPRYESVAALREQAREGFDASWIAEDGMTVGLDRDGAIVEITGVRPQKADGQRIR